MNYLSLFWSTSSFILFIVSVFVSIILFLKKKDLKEKVLSITNFVQIIVVVITLGYLVISLSDLSSMQKLGPILAFVILSNLYASICSLLGRIYLIYKKL